ncbi:MAG: 16S rRNA processing protein RimM [Melioribacteraceae bacterium]|nr:16S rRNA processing protein RimM [Melioribacteraceae bacterium]
MEDYFIIGNIKLNYNEDGFVLIKPFTDFNDRFFDLDFVYIKIFGVVKKLFIDNVKVINNDVVLKFRNFNSSADTKALIGLDIFVDDKNAVKLDEDMFFVHDLIGCKVYYNNEFFGEVTDVLLLVSNDILVVKDPDNNEHLIPIVNDYIGSVQTAEKKIRLINDPGSMYYDED